MFEKIVGALWLIAFFCPVPHWFALAVVFVPLFIIVLEVKY